MEIKLKLKFSRLHDIEEKQDDKPYQEGENLTEKNRKHLLAFLGAAHSLNHSLFLVAPPLLLIIMKDLETSQLTLGVIGTLSSMIYGLGSLVGGPLSDKINEIKIITICLAFAGASTFIFIFASNIFIYSLALFLMAAWASLYHPTANSLISKEFHGQMAEAMGIHGVGGTLGIILTPIVAFSIGIAFGWRISFIVFGVLSVVLAILLLRNRSQTVRTQSKIGILELFKIKGLWIILVFNVVIGLYMKGIEYFLPTYLTLKPFQALDQETAKFWAAMAATLVLASGVLGQWLGGKASDRIGSKKVLIAASVGVLTSLLFLQFTPIWLLGVSAFIVLYGVSFYGHQPALNSLTGIMTPTERRGVVYGIFFFTSFGLGSISQAVAGYFMDKYGSVEPSFYILTIFAVIALALSFIIPDKREKQTEKS